MKKGQMPAFIQAIYGTVLGVSSFNFYERIKERFDLHTDFWDGLSSGPVLFDFFFFIMTLLIIAHDWFSYHDNEPDSGRNYYYYIGDVLALFFVAQMFAVANYEGIRYWYLFGLGYTACNAGNFIRDIVNKKVTGSLIWKKIVVYLVHAAVVAISLWQLPGSYNTYTADILGYYAWWIAVTSVLILVLWLWIDNHEDKDRERTIGTISVNSTVTLDIIKNENKASYTQAITLQEGSIRKDNLSDSIFKFLNEDKGIRTSEYKEILGKIKAFVNYKIASIEDGFNEEGHFKNFKEHKEYILENKDKEPGAFIDEHMR